MKNSFGSLLIYFREIAAVCALALFIASFVCLATLTVFEIAILFAVAGDELLGKMVLNIRLKFFNLVYLFTFELSLFFGHFLFTNPGDMAQLVLAILATASTIAEISIFETLTVAIKARLAIITPSFGLCSFCKRSVRVKEFF